MNPNRRGFLEAVCAAFLSLFGVKRAPAAVMQIEISREILISDQKGWLMKSQQGWTNHTYVYNKKSKCWEEVIRKPRA